MTCHARPHPRPPGRNTRDFGPRSHRAAFVSHPKRYKAAAETGVDEMAATGDTDIRGYRQRTEYTLTKPSNCLTKQDHLNFANRRETDIKHMVATSEAHDSGLCAADTGTKRRFVSDLLNLTLAAPVVNRYRKSGKDAGEWMPRMNRCWFAGRVVAVRRKYVLTVDAREAHALEGALSGCASTEMVVAEGQGQVAEPTPSGTAPSTGDALSRWDTNGNGRITCREAREHGIAPVHREHPAYPFMRDEDNDGGVCE